MVDKSSEDLAFFNNSNNKHLSEEEIFALNSLNCVGTALESWIFGLLFNNWDGFLDEAIFLVDIDQASCEVLIVDALDSDLEKDFKINLNSENVSACGSHEDVVDKSKAERFLGYSDQGGTLPIFVSVEEDVFICNVEVGVSFQIVLIDSLEAKNENILELVKSVVVK